MGTDQTELLWRAMHCHHDLIFIARVVDKHMPQLHDRVPHLEREIEFGSTEQSLFNELGDANDSHRPDRIIFNMQKIPKTFARLNPLLHRK